MSSLSRAYTNAPGYRDPLLFSTLGHGSVFLFFLLVSGWLPSGETLSSGTLAGGGSGGDFVVVGLADEFSGGSGMYKPALVPQPEVAPIPTAEPKVPPRPSQEVFQQETPREKPPEPAPKVVPKDPQPGAIAREPEPGSGKGGRSQGAGGGIGSGQGVTIGAGTGQGTIESWYVRQVEQRVGQNWLRTSLGELRNSVETVVSFVIRSDGVITAVQVEQPSGIRAVDLAAQRAVRASGPLPPLPREFRGQTLKFVAYFEYPPRLGQETR